MALRRVGATFKNVAPVISVQFGVGSSVFFFPCQRTKYLHLLNPDIRAKGIAPVLGPLALKKLVVCVFTDTSK